MASRLIRNDLELANGPKNTVADESLWGIYVYEDDKTIRYFNFPVTEMTGYVRGDNPHSKCIKRAEAILKVAADVSRWGSKGPPRKVAKDHGLIVLTNRNAIDD